MCIHGALEPERLEKRYDTKLAEPGDGGEIQALQIEIDD